MLRAVRATNADVRPIVARVLLITAILVENPLAVRRPARTEVEVIRVGCDPNAIRSLHVAGPHFVSARARQVERDTSTIRAKAQPVRQPLSRAGKLLRVAA